MVRDVNPDQAAEAIANTKIVFIDAWAPWCGPCLALAPTIEELESKYSDNQDLLFIKLNTQIHKSFAMENGISAIPCVLVYKDGKPASIELNDPRLGDKVKTDRIIGLRPIEQFEEVIEQLI